jgi:hypothetical protein
MKKFKILAIVMIVTMALTMAGCEDDNSSRKTEQLQQEQLQRESIAQSGVPAIKNFREKKLLKQIYELRDQDGLLTYTYICAVNTGKLIFLGESIGYGIPAATQYNNPDQLKSGAHEYTAYPQAEPNGLYSPSSAEGTWVMLKDSHGTGVKPVYVEPRIVVSPFKLDI